MALHTGRRLHPRSANQRTDFDPEDEPASQSDEQEASSDDSESVDHEAGRAHYQKVSSSKLRKLERVELDSKKYGGKPVSRAMLTGDEDIDLLAPEEESDEDPFAQNDNGKISSDVGSSENEFVEDTANDPNEDDEIDSDEAFEEGDHEAFRRKGFVFRGSKTSGNQPLNDEIRNSKRHSSIETTGSEDTKSSLDHEEDSDVISNIESGSARGYDDGSLGGSDVGSNEDEDDDKSMDEDEDEDEEDIEANPTNTDDRKKLRSFMSSDAATISASLSQALSSDAAKGKAVRTQYQTFDRLLDARIKLQKGLTVAQNLQDSGDISGEELKSAMEKAEEAALRLFSTLESIRENILRTNMENTPEPATEKKNKRKRTEPVTKSTTNKELHDRIKNCEAKSLPNRRNIIDKWSSKTRIAAPSHSSLSSSSKSILKSDQSAESKLTTVLDAYLVTSSNKLIAESTSNTTNVDNTNNNDNDNSAQPPTALLSQYQDTIFYQSLLRDMITTRSHLNASSLSSLANSTSNPNLNLGNSTTPLPSKLHPSGSVSASLRGKKIDTKASKGRKVRYTVHEKLENFMAGTGVGGGGISGQWTDAAVREFFGSLMGNRNQLAEHSDDDGDGDDEYQDRDMDFYGNGGDEVSGEMEALKLFRS